MYQTIDEPIEVVGVYKQHHFFPRKFRWHHQEYTVSEITLRSDTKDGAIRKRLYSVMCGGTLYRLEFNRETEAWILQEVWVE